MIDTASILASRYKNNRGQLTAALMGQPVQDPELDAYSALRAMQLLKESDRMAMAQQARGPAGDQPSLMQEAVTPEQPQGLAALAGQPVMAQAPQAPAPVQQAASGGLAGMPTPDYDYAEGGIVALASGGRPSSADYLKEAFANIPQPTSLTEREAGMTEQQAYVNKLYGEDRMAPYLEDIAKERKSIEGNKDRNLGYALLSAAQGIVSDPNMARAAGKAMGAFGSEMQKLEKEDREAKRALRQSEMTLAAAQQARADGKTDKAISLFDKYDTQKQNAQKMLAEVNMKGAEIEKGIEVANIQASVAREGHQIQREGQNKPSEIERVMAKAAKIRKEEGPEAADAFMQEYRDVNEASKGIRYTGPDKSQERAIAIEKLVDADSEGKMLKLKRSTLAGKKDAKSAETLAEIDARLEEIRKEKGKNVSRNVGVEAVTPEAPVGGTRTPTAAAIAALKADPSKRGEFDAYYGPGSAARALGG